MFNQKGMSLIEVTVAMGLMGAAAVGFMTYTQNVAKTESRQAVKNSIADVYAQTKEYLRSNDVCQFNAEGAFLGQVLGSSNPAYQKITSTSTDPARRKVFFESERFLGEETINGVRNTGQQRIYVKKVTYELKKIIDSTAGNIFDKGAELEIGIEFHMCPDNVRMNLNGICDGNKEPRKSSQKFTKNAGVVMAGQKVGQIKCWDPEDGLYKHLAAEDKKLADKNADSEARARFMECLTLARSLFATGTPGFAGPACNITIETVFRDEVFNKAQLGNKTFPAGFVANSATLELVGAGGGGGAYWKDTYNEAGHGGKAGKYNFWSIPGKLNFCSWRVGRGGALPPREGRAGGGGESSWLNCGIEGTWASDGGPGGESRYDQPDTENDNGQDGEAVMRPNGTVFQAGGRGAWQNEGAPATVRGAGGGGDSDEAQGAAMGGDGWYSLRYKEAVIRDDEASRKTLEEWKMDKSAVYIAAPAPLKEDPVR